MVQFVLAENSVQLSLLGQCEKGNVIKKTLILKCGISFFKRALHHEIPQTQQDVAAQLLVSENR